MVRVPAPVAVERVQEAGLTPWFAGSKVTTAVIRSVVPATTAELGADSVTVMMGGRRVMVAEPDLEGSVTEVAVTVTVVLLGMAVGGV